MPKIKARAVINDFPLTTHGLATKSICYAWLLTWGCRFNTGPRSFLNPFPSVSHSFLVPTPPACVIKGMFKMTVILWAWH